MSDQYIPNSYQTPNILVDEIMFLLTPQEWVVLSWMIRHILGFQDRISSRRWKLSLSAIQNGYSTFAGCGLSRPAILKALVSLEKHKIIKKIGKADNDGQEWKLTFENGIDRSGLEKRRAEKKQIQQNRTAKARQSSPTNGVGGQSHLPPVVVSPTYRGWSVRLTAGGQSHLPNQTHFKTHLQTVRLKKPRRAHPGKSDNKPKRAPNPIFDTIARESFQIFDTTNIDPKDKKDTGALIGMIISWLKKDSPKATEDTLMEFYRDYDKHNPGASRPRNCAKFAGHFTAFKQRHLGKQHKRSKKPTPQPEPVRVLSAEELAAADAVLQQAKADMQKASGQ